MARSARRLRVVRSSEPVPQVGRARAPWWRGLVWVGLSLAVHALVLGLALSLPREVRAAVERVDVTLEELEPLPPPPPPPPAPLHEPEPPKAVLPRPPPVKVAVVTPPPVPVATPPPELPADPVEHAPAAPEPPRRVVGLSLESTVAGGAEAFAVGNTRMGQTATVAQEPTGERLPGEAVQPPRRTESPEPDYPDDLRSRGVEGDVGLEVEIDATGKVTGVTVSAPSPFEAFNEAAVEAARRSVYEPAQLGGVALPFVVHSTVRFRLRKGAHP